MVAAPSPEKLLGVRDGLVRYFRDGLDRSLSVAVVPHTDELEPVGLPCTDADVLALARRRARGLAEELRGEYHFYVASEGGLSAIELDGEAHWFVRNWTVVLSPVGEAWGGSGAVELPRRLVDGLEQEQIAYAVPGTRRGGGVMSSLTGGLETRRRATALSTGNALASLFYGMLEGRPGSRRS